MEVNKNENSTVQTIREAAKAVLRGKYIAIQAYHRKQERSQIHNLTLHLKELEKEQKGVPGWISQLSIWFLAQAMISQFMDSSPMSGSVLTAQSLEPALDSVSPLFSAPPSLALCLCLSKINKMLKIF